MWRIDKNRVMIGSNQMRTIKPALCTIPHSNAQMARNVRACRLPKLASGSIFQASSFAQSTRCFSVLNRPPPNYEGHIPLTRTERLGLAIGSGLGSFLDPRRGGSHDPEFQCHGSLLTQARPHCILWRSHRATLLHLQASRSHAPQSNGPTNTTRPTTLDVYLARHSTPPQTPSEHIGLCIRGMA